MVADPTLLPVTVKEFPITGDTLAIRDLDDTALHTHAGQCASDIVNDWA